ncbi:ATP-binding protein [Actinomadura sp. K4S16]|uniref:methylation-associated defense system ATP-binding protein MAD8 n=1 Tax=Actinomadura sp. K4S16 TaxID=1316147 RepID=UPI0011EEA298|nr:ATP-binding protein [Actinomadura sp. K4S16]
MTTGLRELLDDDLEEELARVLAPRLSSLMQNREPGHCARVTEVGAALAVRLCRRIRRAVSNGAAPYVLSDAVPAGGSPRGTSDGTIPADVAISSTKLIELRNPDGDRQRPPLLVFIPPGVHASAEDSFDVATFEEVTLGDVYADLADRLPAELPTDVRHGTEELFGLLDEEKWPPADSLARARYLLTVRLNDADPAAAGAAVFELGLVPDFELFTDIAQVRTRAARNVRQMRILREPVKPERQRVIELGLTDPGFRARLAEFLVETGLEDPRAWTRRIVIDRDKWRLAFQHWPLAEEEQAEEVTIKVGELAGLGRSGDDPAHAEHPVLGSITGQPFLVAGKQGATQLPVSFDVAPDPRSVPGLSKFSVELVSEETGPTGVAVSARVSKNAKSVYRATLKKLRRAELEEGWHFVRVLPLDDDGIPLAVARSERDVQAPNESDRFFVVSDEEIVDDPPPQRSRKHVGLTHALRELQFGALAEGRQWQDVQVRACGWKGVQGAGRHTLSISFGQHGNIEIPLPPALTELERQILADPDRIGVWRLPLQPDRPGTATHQEAAWPDSGGEVLARFREARRSVFATVRRDDSMVVEGRDLGELTSAARSYAESYGALLATLLARAERAGDGNERKVLRELDALLLIDCVRVDLLDGQDSRGELTLVAPTHPLRLLWLTTWAALGGHWLDEGADADGPALSAAHRSLDALSPSGFPMVVPRSGERLALFGGNLTPYWGAFLPTDTEDPGRLLSTLSTALHVPDQASRTAAVSGRVLADRVERYVRLHPYVGSLVVSVVNPGRADHIADMLIDLQGRPALEDLTYDIRLFSDAPEAPGLAEALAQLLRGEWSTAVNSEVFHTPAAPGAAQKLAVSLRPLDEFRSASSDHFSHITMLFDAFGGEQFGTAPSQPRGAAPVHGLRQDMDIDYVEDDDVIAWHKRPRHAEAGLTRAIPGSEELSDLLTALPRTISAAAAAVSTGQVGTELVPQITLTLNVADGTLLHQAHRSSDWVVTVDRTLGVEYFDSPGSARRPDYVIDFDADGGTGIGHHTVISSRSLEELRFLLEPALAQHGFAIPARHTGTFFDQLRLLSGRLAFKLASATPTQRSEVVGLALARLFLDYQGALADQILVPLDAHIDLYREARARADEVGETISLQRTDLALFGLDARRRTVTCRLIEVKNRASIPDLTAYQQLKDEITAQLDRSAAIIAGHFSPSATADRPDRAVKNAQLADFLRPYLERAVRYRTIRSAAADEARWLLERLDSYRLEFTRTGLIFELNGSGIATEPDGDVEFLRIGGDLAQELLDAIPTDAAFSLDETSDSLARIDLNLPRLEPAAFRAPARPHELPLAEPLTDPAPDEPRAVDSPAERPDGASVPSNEPPKPVAALLPALPEHGSRPAARQPSQEPPAVAAAPDIYLGADSASPQYGVLGQTAGRSVALDLNETHTISLFGVQGGGKSYTLGSIVEAASLPAPPVNSLPNPLATIVFHYSQTLDYAPEFTSMVKPNDSDDQIRALRETYGVEPRGLDDVVMLVPEDQLEQRVAEYPEVRVLPLKFGSAELRAEHWRFLMGAVGNQSTYIRQLQRIMRAHRRDLRLDVIRDGVDQSTLPDHLKQLAQQRLDLASDYIDDGARIKELVRPGRMIIVDLRDEFVEKDDALGLFVVLMQLFAEAQNSDRRFNKLVVFDEAHKYIDSPDLVDELVASVREMRHKGMSVLVASQDPPSVPVKLIELSNHVILHKFTSPAWLKHMQKAITALNGLTPSKLASLSPGEAYIWSSKTTDAAFNRGAVKVRLRPRITRHGGATRTATG